MSLFRKNVFASRVIIWIISIALVGFFIGFGIYTTWRTHCGSTDFDTYYYAARDVIEGSSVYTEHEDISPYIYPPCFACLLVPLGLFSMEIASFVWYFFSLIFFFLAIFLSFVLILGKNGIIKKLSSFPFLPKAMVFAIIAGLFIDNMSMLQANALICFAIVSALYFFRKKMHIFTGLFLGMAISVKMIPIIFLIYFIVKREFRMCVSAISWTVVFSFLVPSLYMGIDGAWQSLGTWNSNMLQKSTSFTPNFDMMLYMFNPQNQSVTAFAFRWLVKNDFVVLHLKRVAHEFPAFMINWTLSLTKETALYVSKTIVLLICGGTLFYCFRKIKNRTSPLWNYEYSLMFLLSLIANPVLKTQQLIFVIFPLIFLLTHTDKTARDRRFFYWALLCFSFLYLSQVMGFFKILGFGTLSILWLWFAIMIKYARGRCEYL